MYTSVVLNDAEAVRTLRKKAGLRIVGKMPFEQREAVGDALRSLVEEARANQPAAQTQQSDVVDANQHVNSKSGIVKDKYFRKANLLSKDVRLLEAFCRATGTVVRFAEQVNGGDNNGKYENSVITLALDSNSPLRVVFTHELIHRIKDVSPETYQALKEFVLSNMSEEALRNRTLDTKATYTELNDIDIQEEVIADAFGTILGDENRLEQFVSYNRNAAQKIYDCLRDLIVKVKRTLSGTGNVRLDDAEKAAFSELTAELDGMAQAFASALETTAQAVKDGTVHQKRTEVKNNVKINVRDVDALQSMNLKSINAFSGNEKQKTEKFARKYFAELGVKSPFFRAWFGDWRKNERKTPVHIVTEKGKERGKVKNADTGWLVQVSGKVFSETNQNANKNRRAIPYLEYIDSIVENAILLDSFSIPKEKRKSYNSALMHSMYAVCDIGKGAELLKLYVEELNDVNSEGTINRAYQLQNIEIQQRQVRSSPQRASSIKPTADVKSVADLFQIVKERDEKFNPQKSSKVVDENGKPKIVFHGTPNDFTVFDSSRNKNILFGNGHYFGENREKVNLLYGEKVNGRVVEAYLDIKNPFTIKSSEIGNVDEVLDYINSKLGESATHESVQKVLKNKGYDGVHYETQSASDIWVAFDSNQIKVADNIGTFNKEDPDIRHSRKGVAGAYQKKLEQERERNRKREAKLEKEYRERENKLMRLWSTRDLRKSLDKHLDKLTTIHETRNKGTVLLSLDLELYIVKVKCS